MFLFPRTDEEKENKCEEDFEEEDFEEQVKQLEDKKEIEEEDDEHEFFFTSSVSGLTISKTDTDGNGNPLGLETSITSGAAGSGSITVVLKHEPTKPNDGTSASAGGSTDIEVTFNVTVE